MKSVTLKGVVIRIGDKVRFIDNSKMDILNYVPGANLPELKKEYTVRGFSSKGGFLLEEVVNEEVDIRLPNGNIVDGGEFGFAIWRFEPANPLYLEVLNVASNKKVNIEMMPLVEERIATEEYVV